MGLLNRIEELEKELAELKCKVKEGPKFPEYGDGYWYIDDYGYILNEKWDGLDFEEFRLEIGNMFKTKEQAEFAVEKLKVEAELQKFGRPFKEDEYNYFIEINSYYKYLAVHSNDSYRTQGTIYFESTAIANEATDTVGEERIKKYIFGVED